MTEKEMNRVVFHSKEDMSCMYHLQKVEKRLSDINLQHNFEINDLLEFYHIKLYFDHDLFFHEWNENQKVDFQNKINLLWVKTKDFLLSLNSQNALIYIDEIELHYQKSFWGLIQNLGIYKKIDKDIFSYILNKKNHLINSILLYEKIVNYFGSEIRDFLLSHINTAELLLSQIEDKRVFEVPSYYFPKCFSHEDKEKLLLEYINSEHANLNYIRLIEYSRDLKLSSKIKLKAQKRAIELNNKILDTGNCLSIQYRIEISLDQIEPIKYFRENNISRISYSKLHLDQQTNDLQLFNLFSSIFELIDSSGLITLVSKESELSIFEKIGLNSKNAYLTGISFSAKENFSFLQIIMFDKYLKERNNSITNILESFITQLNISLKDNFKLKFTSDSATFLEKIRTLAPELEYFLKQYNCYVTENKIDFELLEFDSIPIKFSVIPSLVEKKYIYPKGDTLNKLKYYFFSDQCLLCYIDPYKGKYKNFYSLLISEKIKLTNFKEHQIQTINLLIEEGYLYIDKNLHLKIKDSIFLFLIGELYANEVLNYWHYPENMRPTIDKMINNGLVYSESTLFSKQETNYLNFYLNTKEYTNGREIRNKYIHGSNPTSEKQHFQDYYIFLRIMILILLKIRDDVYVKYNSLLSEK